MKVLVLAGGFATRLWPLCEHRAKPLLLVAGQTILAHLLSRVPSDAEVILLTNKKFEQQFRDELKKIGRKSVEIFCEDAYSDGQKLGALGALSAVCRAYNIHESVLVLAGDNLLPGLPVEQLFCSKDEARIAVRRVDSEHEARKFGVVEVEGNRVVRFEEKPDQPRSTLVSTGFLSIGSDWLPALHEVAVASPDALGGIFPELVARGADVRAVEAPGDWFDVGSFETYLGAHRQLQSKLLVAGADVREHKNELSGRVYLGDGAVVENCQLHDVIVYPGARLQNCVISNSVIDENCRLRGLDLNGKLVRAGTRLDVRLSG